MNNLKEIRLKSLSDKIHEEKVEVKPKKKASKKVVRKSNKKKK